MTLDLDRLNELARHLCTGWSAQGYAYQALRGEMTLVAANVSDGSFGDRIITTLGWMGIDAMNFWVQEPTGKNVESFTGKGLSN